MKISKVLEFFEVYIARIVLVALFIAFLIVVLTGCRMQCDCDSAGFVRSFSYDGGGKAEVAKACTEMCAKASR